MKHYAQAILRDEHIEAEPCNGILHVQLTDGTLDPSVLDLYITVPAARALVAKLMAALKAQS